MDERKKTDEIKRRREKNELKGSRWELYCNFSDGITNKLLNNIIFNYSVSEFSQFVDKILNFALKFLNKPLEFSQSVGTVK